MKLHSLRRRFSHEPTSARAYLEEYLLLFQRAFPLPAERESQQVYEHYLTKSHSWDILVFEEPDNNIVGGAHIQALSAENFPFLVAEHFWVDEPQRNFPRFHQARTAIDELAKKNGCRAILMESNDPHLMTQSQQETDAASGITTQDRVSLWRRYFFALDAWYAQPSLGEDSPPVEYLMLCIRPFDETLRELSLEQYLGIVKSYHQSIVGKSKITEDPTFQKICEMNSGIRSVKFIDPTKPRSCIEGS